MPLHPRVTPVLLRVASPRPLGGDRDQERQTSAPGTTRPLLADLLCTCQDHMAIQLRHTVYMKPRSPTTAHAALLCSSNPIESFFMCTQPNSPCGSWQPWQVYALPRPHTAFSSVLLCTKTALLHYLCQPYCVHMLRPHVGIYCSPPVYMWPSPLSFIPPLLC